MIASCLRRHPRRVPAAPPSGRVPRLVAGLLVLALAAGAALEAVPGAQPSAAATPRAARPALAAATSSPTATMTAPAAGSSVAAGSPVTLAAALSPDLVTALAAGTDDSCWFAIADDTGSITRGTLDLTAGRCTGTWTFDWAGSYGVSASIGTSASVTYTAAAVAVTVTGSADPRCTGGPGAPAACVYRWAEIYYPSAGGRAVRVCAIDSGCQWQSAHTAWQQAAGKDYWVDSTGTSLPDGNGAEAYFCLGSSPAGWDAYTAGHDVAALLARADTSAEPVPAGTC